MERSGVGFEGRSRNLEMCVGSPTPHRPPAPPRRQYPAPRTAPHDQPTGPQVPELGRVERRSYCLTAPANPYRDVEQLRVTPLPSGRHRVCAKGYARHASPVGSRATYQTQVRVSCSWGRSRFHNNAIPPALSDRIAIAAPIAKVVPFDPAPWSADGNRASVHRESMDGRP